MLENSIPTRNEDASVDLTLVEFVPSPLATQILLRLLVHPDADRRRPPMAGADIGGLRLR